MKKIIILTLVFCLPTILLSNGGPDGYSLESSGNISLQSVKNIQLVSEKLYMKPKGDRVNVNVKYLLNNKGQNMDVNYGFPFFNSDYTDSFISFDGNADLMVKNFSLLLNGKKISLSKRLDKDEETNKETFWYICTLPVKKGENTIIISYEATSFCEDWSTNKSPLVHYSDRVYTYNLQPAKGWGNGILPDLEVEINMSDVINRKGTFNISGINTSKTKDGIFSAKITNLNLNSAIPIKVTYNNAKYYNTLEAFSRKTEKISGIKNIKASSTLKGNYNVKNLTDTDYRTAWVEGEKGTGIGEWVEIEFTNSAKITTMQIANGYLKSQKTYFENASIKTLKCEFTLQVGNSERKITKNIKLEKFKEYNLLGLPESSEYYSEAAIDFKEIILSPNDIDYLYSIKKARLTILEVYPGTKYEDTCISEIYAF